MTDARRDAPPRVKICGITRPADRDAAVAAGADAIGVICDVPVDTPREVDAETAVDLVAGVPPLATSVLVTMPRTVQEATRLVETVEPDAVQIHGGLSPREVGALGRRLSQDVVVAVDADDAADASTGGTADAGASDAASASDGVADYADVADALLVDSVDAEGGGGTGETHDWERTRDLVADLDVPVVIAGGLTPDNVAAAVNTVEPFAVDVASGVERDGGVKDHDAVREFVRAATTEVRAA